MASSNKHWPSMFRSNPAACDFHHQPDMSNTHTRPSLISSGLDQETTRSPGETKPRWNPRPEQIRILEGIFNSGVVNPPRDEIRRIRLRLQEYGHVADANVFYWFQNRKSRTKNKLRAAAAAAAAQGQQPTGGRAAVMRASLAVRTPALAPVTPPRRFLAPCGTLQAPTSSSSSSSDRSSGSSRSVTMKTTAMASSAVASLSQPMLPLSTAAIDLFAPAPPPLTPSPGLSACQLYYQLQNHPMTSMPTPTPVRELVTSTPEPAPLLPQWPPQSQCQYLPATELGGFLGSHGHTHPTAVSPGALLLSGLCTDSVLGQHEIVDDMSCSKLGLGVGGQYHFNVPADPPSDAVSAVIKDDEKARLGFLHHYGLGATAGADVSATALPCTPPIGNAAASSAFTDQLQGLLDAGLLTGGGAPVPTATVVAVAAGRPGAPVQCYSVPAMARMDVKALFGPAAVLLGQTGEAIPVDGAGVTAEPLQNGACYYVLM
ncbi:WUSCHEL-related homeobox 12-like [Aegilops tauschii subsp. strangulata]|uniref:Homeobox domain-containing protein n=2 Tax=Aegilops tauschii subsp. strangulata TaxID=200361 RepID=A0A452ZWY6_AEGTS|nr:WUSCHEL-related homeobox 12-like [Aegilops tauschii subsp. strangulata]